MRSSKVCRGWIGRLVIVGVALGPTVASAELPDIDVTLRSSGVDAGVSDEAHAAMSKRLADYFDAIRSCAQDPIAKAPRKFGTISLTLKVTASGSVTASTIKTWSPQLEMCVQSKAKRWTFPGSGRAMTFSASLELDGDAAARFANLLSSDDGASEGDMSSRRPSASLGIQLDAVPRIAVVMSTSANEAGAKAMTAEMQRLVGQFADCYRTRFGSQTPAGRVQMAFEVNAAGTVGGFSVMSWDKALDTCVAGKAKAWVFPRAARSQGFEVTVAYGDAGPVIGGGAGRGGSVKDALKDVKAADRGEVRVLNVDALDNTSLTNRMVEAKLKTAYLSGVQRCYRTALARVPTLKGKLRVNFEVTDTGAIGDHTVDAPDAALKACVLARVKGFRFAVPLDGAEPTSATFAVDIGVRPE